ncbi:protein DGS1, mitochondrial isoform X2 [Rhodamnia argentea]|uniref:Protein DGS1, mitochondrial isoform X2 n=1 Tax=Rhodamnia argentea TaxID=178133 RepID=A0ABM3HH99_9MYRT|nr:protein DGS1, mitochondrial isoform X2 [Rhodamnia argentea]
MEAPTPETESKDLKALASFYSSYVWNRLFGSSPSPGSSFLGKISRLYRQTARPRSRRRTSRLPLPLPSNSADCSVVLTEASRVYDVLEDIMEHVLSYLHDIQKHLQFWQTRAEGSNGQKMFFMIFERGPLAFVDETVRLIQHSVTEGSSLQHFCHSASAHISERITILTYLRCSLASFLAEVYVEVDKRGEELVKSPEKSLPSLLVVMDGLFSKLEESIGSLPLHNQNNSSPDGSYSHRLAFYSLPTVIQEGSQWTDREIGDAVNLVYQNIQKLESYLSFEVAKYKMPRKVTQYWISYTCGAVGFAACSMWLVRHSSLMGSSDINNWIREARDSTLSFFNDHVEQPLLSIRDELFETFRKRHESAMELEEVHLTAESLHRMLQAFSEQAEGQKLPEDASDQQMLEIVMARYEKELMHPVKNLLSGELARALLIQVQKLKLDIETAMLELNQILRANEINFAILAALPAFFLSLILLMIMRAWLKQDTKAEGRGRVARLQRRLLLVEIEKRIMQYQNFINQGLVEARYHRLGKAWPSDDVQVQSDIKDGADV